MKVVAVPHGKRSISDTYAELFEALARYWETEVPTAVTPTDERVALALKEVDRDASRICYFVVPRTEVGWYRENVFPIFRSRGLLPLTADDLVAPGEAITAVVELTRRRARAVVIEISTAQQRYEAERALTVRDGAGVLLIHREAQTSPYQGSLGVVAEPTSVLYRGLDTDAEAKFIRQIESWLESSVPESGAGLAEPRRLLELRAYSAAVVAAVTELEVALSHKLEASLTSRDFAQRRPAVRWPPPLHELVVLAREHLELGDDETFEQVRSVVNLRNQVVHGRTAATAAQARRALDVVGRVLAHL